MSVYFAQSCGYTKIGYSGDPIQRAESITRLGERPAEIPHKAPATLLGWIPGDRSVEATYHRRFADQCVEAEWFSLDEAEVRSIIWDDPRGVDMQRMSGLAVFAALRHPELTRDEIAATYDMSIEATTLDYALTSLGRLLMNSKQVSA